MEVVERFILFLFCSSCSVVKSFNHETRRTGKNKRKKKWHRTIYFQHLIIAQTILIIYYMPVFRQFMPGDFLVFQLESGFGLLRVLDVKGQDDDPVWHIAAYKDLFMDVDMAEAALQNPTSLTIEKPHLALTNRAFESTQVAKMTNVPLNEEESSRLDEPFEISDRSVRLMLGLR